MKEVIDTNTTGTNFKFENRNYKLQNQSFSFVRYKNFNLDKLLIPKTNANLNSTRNGVLTQAPTLDFVLNPVFVNAITNVYNLSEQVKDLEQRLESKSNESEKAGINSVLTQIKNKQVDYLKVKEYISSLDKDTNKVSTPINSTGWVKWYQEANKELGLNLNQEPKDWDQFLKLVASYFSMAIYANVTLGQKITKEVKVWDGQNFQFLAIENNEDQAQCFSKRKQSWNYC